jgi:hypothetical protein
MRISVMVILWGALLAGAPAQEAAPAAEGAAFAAEGREAAPAVESPAPEVEAGPSAPSEPWALPVEADGQVKIRKVYEFLNDPKKTSPGSSRGLAYEFKYFDHGAVTRAQQRSRKGQYFVVTWSNGGTAADYVLRLDYRQAVSRDRVNTLEIPYKQARGTFKGTFSVTGEDYFEFGDVHSWRISLVRGGRIVAQEQSFVW